MKASRHIVSTKMLRPEWVHQLEESGASVTQHNFITKQIQLPHNLLRQEINSVIALTSQTAVEAWMEIVKKLQLEIQQYKIYCLSEGTQQLARQLGLNIAGVAYDGPSLGKKILEDKAILSVSFVCGNRRRNELPASLNEAGVKVHEILAYKSELTPITIARPIDGILFFSPSGIDSFLSENKSGESVAFCLGNTTASHARQNGFKNTHVAEAHTPAALVKSVIDHCKNQSVHA